MTVKEDQDKALTWLDRAAEQAKEIELVPTAKLKKNLRPLNKWVLIRKHLRKSKLTESGLAEAVTDAERSWTGTVIGAARDITIDLKVGDVVLFTAYAMTIEDVEEVTGDPNLFLVCAEEIYAVVEDAPKCT